MKHGTLVSRDGQEINQVVVLNKTPAIALKAEKNCIHVIFEPGATSTFPFTPDAKDLKRFRFLPPEQDRMGVPKFVYDGQEYEVRLSWEDDVDPTMRHGVSFNGGAFLETDLDQLRKVKKNVKVLGGASLRD